MRTSISGVNDRGLFIGFLALLFWAPLPLGSNRPWAWHLLELVAFVLLLFWGCLYLRGKVVFTKAIKHSQGLFSCLGCFALAIAIQLIPLPAELVAWLRPLDPLIESGLWPTISIDWHITWIHLRTTLAFIAFAFLTLVLINTPARLKTLALLLLCSGLFQAVYGSLMMLSGLEYGFFVKKEEFHEIATGTFWNRNHFANYLIMCLSAGIALLLAELYQRSSSGWRERGIRILRGLLEGKFFVRIGLALMVIALVLSKSRMGNTAFFISLTLSGVLWLWLTKRVSRASIVLLLSFLLVDTLILGSWFGIDQVKDRLESSALTGETRDEVNRDTWGMIKQQPLLGAGAGSYYTDFSRYRQGDIQGYYNHAHNDYFQFVAEHGVLGTLPLVVLVLKACQLVWQTMRRRRDLFFQSMAFLPLMSLIAMALHCVVDFNLQIPANGLTFLVIVSLAWVLRYMPSRRGSG